MRTVSRRIVSVACCVILIAIGFNAAVQKLSTSEAEDNDPRGPGGGCPSYSDITQLPNQTGYERWYYYIGDMINAHNGNLYFSEKDLSIRARGFKIEIERTYNTVRRDIDSRFGYGWHFNYNLTITNTTNYVYFQDADGTVHNYTKSGSDYIHPPGFHSKLVKNGNSSWSLKNKDGTVFNFNIDGQLLNITDKNGNKLTFTYSHGKLTEVRDDSNIAITINYDANNRISSITDPLSRKIEYKYNSGELMNVTDIISDTMGDGNKTHYIYTATVMDAHLLSIVTDRVNKTTNITYDSLCRVTETWYGQNPYKHRSFLIDYTNSPNINVTNAESNKATIELNSNANPERITGPQVSSSFCSLSCSLEEGLTDSSLPQTSGCSSCSGNVKPLLPIEPSPFGCGSCCGGSCGPIGTTVNYTWDSDFNLTAKGDANNKTYVYDYNALGNVINRTDPTGNYTTYGWNNIDNSTLYISLLVNTTDELGRTTTYEYDYKGNLNKTTDATGNSSYIYYDYNEGPFAIPPPPGYPARIVDYRGYETIYKYSSHGDLINVTNALNQTTKYDYDIVGRLLNETVIVGGINHTAKYSYDANNRVTNITDALNHSTLFYYNARGDLIKIKDPNGYETTYTINITLKKVATVTDPLNHTTTYTYDKLGNLVKVVDARGYNTSYQHDYLNRLTKITDAKGNDTIFVYNDVGDVTTVSNRRGYNTTYSYDSLHRVTNITDAMGNSTTFTYDAVGNLKNITNARGYTTIYYYDDLGRLIKIKDPLNHNTTLEYDANGNLIKITDAIGNSVTYTYNEINQMTEIADALNHTTKYGYDEKGNLINVTDANNHITTYTYDFANRLIKLTDALNYNTTFDYDAVGNLLNITDANNHTTKFQYNAANELTKITSPLNHNTSLFYDANYNLVGRLDANGNNTTFAYDELNRLISVTYPNGNGVTIDYDAEGNILNVSDNSTNFKEEYTYDTLNRISSVTLNYSSFERTITYTYDQNGNKKTITDPNGGTTTYYYDAADRLTSIVNPSGDNFSFEYDNANRRTKLTYPNGIYTNYTYDVANRIMILLTKNSTGSIIQNFTYAYDNVGNRLNMTESDSNITTYVYDNTNQLISVTYPNNDTVNYTFDGVGNRLKKIVNGVDENYTYDADNRLTFDGTYTYSYDNNGNIISKTDGANTTTYEWDYENRLKKITFPDESTIEYEYSAIHSPHPKRMSKTNSSGTVYYLYDLEDILMELNASGNQVANYTHGPEIDEPLSMTRSSSTYYYLHDALGSIKGLADNNQNVVVSYQYDVFGSIRSQFGNIWNPYRFTAREWDADTELYYYRARYYDPEVGRFLSKDPARFVDGPNLYAYVKNNPVNEVDPSGLGCVAIDWGCLLMWIGILVLLFLVCLPCFLCITILWWYIPACAGVCLACAAAGGGIVGYLGCNPCSMWHN